MSTTKTDKTNNIKDIINTDRKYSLFAILSAEDAERVQSALLADEFTADDITCYQGEGAARAFLERHEGFVGVLRKMFVGHQVDVDKRYSRALHTDDCVLKVHIGQERSAKRDRAELVILEAGGRDVYFFGEASYRDVVKQKQPTVRSNVNPNASG